ncbi:hypothetical protein D0812_22175 [Vibrio owensii]|uniref:Uncharacterized protein n=1 Tax=Vibrio owensii TaxID=696485 RepID=A0AAP9GFW2_9VIBR|nr:hypothetical protein [Vibrio owensii]AYO17099.1 hypothetical protein D0812_22175 [Vibrio owensii]QGH49244.1 hypothetical protein APZ19_19185 [Vibrio owensii]
MSDNTRFWVGITLTIATNLAVYAFFQGGLNQNVKALSSDLNDFKVEVKADLSNVNSKVYSVKSSTDANGLVLGRVDRKVDGIDDKVTDYGERIAKLETITGGGNAYN